MSVDLFPGEEINVSEEELGSHHSTSDAAVNEKYVRGDIRIVTEQARYPLTTIPDIVQGGSYRLSPEYQRRHRWSKERKSRLIESLIMNVPIPPIFLYEYDYSKYEVMDGLQRLTAINEFYENKYELEGLTQWSELNGRLYRTLPDKVREGVDRRYLSSVILLKETAKTPEDALRLKQMVFERINSGGELLTPQETRNAIFDGPMNRLCIKLSRNPSLCRLWGIPEPATDEDGGEDPSQPRIENESFRRMEDVELVLRFFAYRQKSSLHRGTSLSNYYDLYLKRANAFSDETLLQLKELFEQTVQLAEDVFGNQAFWMWRQRGKEARWSWLERATTTIYDPMMCVLSAHLSSGDKLRSRAGEIRDAISGFYEANYDKFEGRNVNPSALVLRERALFDFIAGYTK